MALDLNVSPFFDDYSEDKKFYRILFRPGYAVQARELTQLQTILQQQIKRHGDHIFKQGSMVIPGQVSYDTDVYCVTLTDYTGIDSYLDSILNQEITNSSGLISEVVAYTLAENDDPVTVFIKYKNSVIDENTGNNISTYTLGDTLYATDNTIVGSVVISEFAALPTAVGKASTATIKKGVYYINDNFVLVEDQTIVLDKYDQSPSYKVGLQLVETVVYPEDDESLLDNALGSPNYSAPGAARYYMDLQLSKTSLSSTVDPNNFIELLRLDKGKVLFKIDRSQYAELEKTMARRTYDESGDYALSPFNIQVRHYRNNYRLDWAGTEKYIQGDVIRTRINSSLDYYHFTCTKSGISTSDTSPPNFSTDPLDGYVTDGTVYWEYTPLPLFNQGVYTFTAGDEAYSNFTIDDHIRLDGMLAYGVEKGKAYVRGYEIEKLATEYVPSNKARYLPAGSSHLADFLNTPTYFREEDGSLAEISTPVSVVKTQNIDTSMGSYILVKTTVGAPDIIGLRPVTLKANTDVIGTARIRGMEYHDTILTVRVYKLFLFDININSGFDISNLTDITGPAIGGSGTFTCDAYETSTTVYEPANTSLVYQLSDYAINAVSEMDYTVVVPFTGQTSVGDVGQIGQITLTSPNSAYTFESGNVNTNYVVINSSGEVVIPTGYGTAGGTTITISVSSGTNYTVFATMKRANSSTAYASGTITDDTDILTSIATAQVSEIVLEKPYVYRIVSVKMAAAFGEQVNYDVDITNRYIFRANSTLSMIRQASLVLQDGAPYPTGSIKIRYEYIAIDQNTSGDVLSVESYLGSTSAIKYEDIVSINGVALRDSIDFRPIMSTSVDVFNLRYFPKYGETTTVQYTHYLSKVDNIVMTSTGQYVVSEGVPGYNPVEQPIPANSMKLARMLLEPYTFGVDSHNVSVERVENKRYTMRDIGKLERRIQDLEYYTSLSLLELDTKNLKVIDSTGAERFQNGFIVDKFDGQGVGNSSSSDWCASIDSDNKELRPFFNQRQIELLEDANKANKKYVINGDLITLPFTEVSLIDQPKSSRREFVNPYALYSYIGIMTLTPWADTWFSTERRPDIILNDEGQYNAVVAMAEEQGVLGTVWNSWQTVFSSTNSLASRMDVLGKKNTMNTVILNDQNNGGTFWRARSTFTSDELGALGIDPALAGNQAALSQRSNVGDSPYMRVLTIETEAVETTSARKGVRSYIVDKVDSRVLEDRVVDTKVVPYIRPRTVLIRGYGYRSNTRLYSFFDGANVDRYIECATRIEYTKVGHDVFTTTRNCGSNVENPERLVSNATGVYITGTVSIDNGTTTVTGSTTSFLSEVSVGDTVYFSENDRGYMVATVTDNTTLTIRDAYEGTSTTDTAMSVLSKKFSNTTVEMAFAHGEVVKEYTSAGSATGRSFVVVGQEVNAGKYYLWVLNEKGDKQYKTGTGYYLEGEYTDNGQGTKPKVRFAARTAFSNLISSATGQVNGIFRIPNNPVDKFRTGTREFKVTDSSSNSTNFTTHGSTFYEANGLIEVKQRTIVSTRTAEIAAEVVSDTQTIVNVSDRVVDDSGWFDPLAQTFLVQNDGGCFITSVDLYFASTDPTGKIPVRLEIREVVNGYPGKFVLPFSRVQKKPNEINVDAIGGGTVATNFKFQSPVYLQNGTEYALTVLSDSNAYEIWISQTLETDIATSSTINSQPYSGVFFKSQNASTWTADQTQDMKFKIYRANFTQSSADVDFIAPTLNVKSLPFNPFNFVENGTQMRVEHRDHGFKNDDVVKYTNRQLTTFVNGIPATYLFNTGLSVSKVEPNMYVVELSTVLPRSNSTLTPSIASKTFTMSGNYTKAKFDAFRAGSTVIRFTAYNSITDTVYADSYMQGTITSISATQIVVNVTEVGTDTTTAYSSWILTSTSEGRVGGSYISATENYEYQTSMLTANTNILESTGISFNVTGIQKQDRSKEIISDVQIKENYDFNEEMVLPNDDNYSSENASGKKLKVTAKLTTSNSALSPAIDLHGIAMTLINNKLNNPDVLVNDSSLDQILLGDNVDLSSTYITLTDGTVTGNKIIRLDISDAGTLSLYKELNRLQIGSVCMFEYTGVTDNYYQTLVDKYTDGTYQYFEFAPEYDPSTGALSASLGDTANVDIYWMSHYVNEIAPHGGSVISKYVTKKINFSRPSEIVQIMFAALIPDEAEVDVYYKTGLNATGNFELLPYKKLAATSGYYKNNSEFYDMMFRAESVEAFDTIIVKLVMRSTNRSKTPRIKDLRIVCAA